MFDFLGVVKTHLKNIDARLSPNGSGRQYIASNSVAHIGGLAEGFNGKVFYEAAALGTPVQACATASKTYILQGSHQPIVVITDADGAASDCGIPDAVAGSARGILRLACKDTNTTAVGVGFHQANQNWITPEADFVVSFDVNAIVNAQWGNTISLAQFGLMSDKAANFLVVDSCTAALTNAPSTDFVMVELSENKARLVTKLTTASTAVTVGPWMSYVTTDPHVFTIEYLVARKQLILKIDGQESNSTSISRTGALPALQVFARVGHLAAYTAATHAPFGIDIDAVVANVPKYTM